MGNTIMFVILAVVILASALLCVTTTRIMRAATFLLFVLFGVAGIYFLLDYTFLGAAQISVYAGGVTMIYVFAIQLVSKRTLQGLEERVKSSKMIAGGLAALAGLVVVSLILLKTGFYTIAPANVEVPMKEIGTALVGAGKYQYVLAFEFISLFLRACIIGGLVVARKEKKEESVMIPVECYFALSALLFFIGVYGFVTRRNLIAMLISVELVLNAVDINFAAINRLLYPNGMEGMFMTLFVIGVAAAESAVAIAIIINVYRNFHSDSVDSIKNMKW